MNNEMVRWGILGTAQIARKNWQALRLAGNSVLAGVASRNEDRAREFIQECQGSSPWATPPRPFGSYEALLAAPEIEAVYIPLPTGLRKEWVIRAARAGKHVVCEKPCANNASDLREMLEACAQHGVQFMDGVMFSHHPRLAALREAIAGGAVGQVRRVTSAFSFLAPEEFFQTNIRARAELEPLGCLGDLGWYCVRLALSILGGELPRAVTGRILRRTAAAGESWVPTEFSGELAFGEHVSCGFFCSFHAGLEQWAQISGTAGGLTVRDFVLPIAGHESVWEREQLAQVVTGCDFKIEAARERVVVPGHSHGHATAQETELFRSFAGAVRSGQLHQEWPDIALKTQRVIDALFGSAQAGGAPRSP